MHSFTRHIDGVVNVVGFALMIDIHDYKIIFNVHYNEKIMNDLSNNVGGTPSLHEYKLLNISTIYS